MTTPDAASHFYLSRHGKAHGPLSWDEIRNHLAYGSVGAGELLSLDGRKDWRSLDQWREVVEGPLPSRDEAQDQPRGLSWFISALCQALKPAETGTSSALPRRRSVRFRNWEHVPGAQRSTHVLGKLVSGFFFFPPRLWSASATVFSQHIFRRSTDEAGFLKIWSRAAETACAVLILINALWWTVLIVLLNQYAFPAIREVVISVSEKMAS